MAIAEYDLSGTVALVTGAGRGIGKGIAQALAEAGAAGKVINIGSFASARGGAGLTIYAAAKTALVGFTRALALEWALHGVQVNGIAPGLFPDPVTAGEAGYAERVENAKRVVPLRREGRLREVGLLAVYLASRASDYMTGQTLYLDESSGNRTQKPRAAAAVSHLFISESVARCRSIVPSLRSNLTVYLASCTADHMTGQTLYLDGGLTL